MITGRQLIIALAVEFNGDFDRIYAAMKQKFKPSEETILAANASIPTDVKVVTIIDEDYPDNLKRIYKPPFVLFMRGNTNLLTGLNTVAAVGDLLRDEHIPLFESSSDFSFVLSAMNNDRILKACSNDKSIYISNVGIGNTNFSYPLVISEYLAEPHDNDIEFTSKFSSRLAVGLASKVLFTGVKKFSTSIASIALGYALHCDKPVAVLKTSKDTTSNTKLIKSGMTGISSLSDIFTIDSSESGVDISRLN